MAALQKFKRVGDTIVNADGVRVPLVGDEKQIQLALASTAPVLENLVQMHDTKRDIAPTIFCNTVMRPSQISETSEGLVDLAPAWISSQLDRAEFVGNIRMCQALFASNGYMTNIGATLDPVGMIGLSNQLYDALTILLAR